MRAMLLDVVKKDAEGEMEDVETLPAVIRGNNIYVRLSEGLCYIKKVLTGKDPHSGPIELNGVRLNTRIISMVPGFNAFHSASVDSEVINEINKTFETAFG